MDYESKTNEYLEFFDENIDFESLSKDEILSKYKNLIDILRYHNHKYYIQAKPVISDIQYDKLFKLLKKIEKTYPDIILDSSPTQSISLDVQDEFDKGKHKIPLLSLENSYDPQDLKDYDDFVQRQLSKKLKIDKKEDINYKFSMEPKYDGISIELVYQNGQFTQALTRGDGYVGEDITNNIKTIKAVPKKIKGFESIAELRVRGEVLMPKSSFQNLNDKRLEKGKDQFANPRNAAAGTVRQLDPNVVNQRNLTCFVYELLYLSLKDNDQNDTISNLEHILDRTKENLSQKDVFEWFRALGFFVFPWLKRLDSISKVIEVCKDEETQNWFEKQNVEFDGIVIKLDNFEYRDIIGSTNHHPRWAMAYKFPAKQVSTYLTSIDYQVGRMGTINPVGNLETINLSGAQISKASLHNFDYIDEKDILLGDKVWVQRSGEVIPYIIGPIKEARKGKDIQDGTDSILNKELSKDSDVLYRILPPTKCPVCGGKVAQIDGQVAYYCTNLSCPAVLKHQIKHFVSKNCMNIDGLGEEFVGLLLENDIIESYDDIYKLNSPSKISKLKKLPGMGSKRIQKLNKAIEESKQRPLSNILNALGVKYVGRKMSRILSDRLYDYTKNNNKLESFDAQELIDILKDENFLESIDGIGEKTIQSIIKYLSNPKNQKIIYNLEQNGVRFDKFDKALESDKLADLRFSLTGSFELSRDDIVDTLRGQGASYDPNPLDSTDIMLVGESPGKKLSKAKSKSIPIYNGLSELIKKYPFLEEKFQNLLKEKNKNESKPIQNSLF